MIGTSRSKAGIGAIAGGVALGALLGSLATYGIVSAERRTSPPPTTAVAVGRPAEEPTAAVAVPSTDGPAVPTIPRYGPPPSTAVSDRVPATAAPAPVPASTDAIYRCRSGGRAVYSNIPCDGGALVAGTSAVQGFDSRPSDRLARLVVDGRAPADPPAGRADTRSSLSPVPETTECATMRRQIVDLDAAALRPNSPVELDRIRDVRQDVRTGMARAHCGR